MDSFFVTLPSNSSADVFPDNKKSNFTTHFNTPINLTGEYEVALASITCTRNIKNDYGQIDFNFDHILTIDYMQTERAKIDLSDTYNLQDKINIEARESLTFHQIFRNSLYFVTLEIDGKDHLPKRLTENDVVVFYDIRDKDNLFILSKHADFSSKDNYYARLSWDSLSKYSNVHLFPISNKMVERYKNTPLTELGERLSIIDDFEERQKNPQFKPDLQSAELLSDFDDIYLQINDRDDVGLLMLYCDIKDDKIKFSSNRKINLVAGGRIKELIFNDSKIILDKYYYIPGKLNLVKYGIIYCDIIQEQIFGEDYRQVLQIITLDNSENTPILMSNLENLQYIPVKKNFISNINISIRSLTGELIKFSDDFIYTIVKLHFRKKLV